MPAVIEAQQAAIVRSGRRLATIRETHSPDGCVEAVTFMGFSTDMPEVLLNTRVDAARISGERGAATAHTSAVLAGLIGQVPPVNITLLWVDGHWLIDRRTACRWGITAGDLLDRIFDETGERKQAAEAACTT
jgi:hypothetical protein